MVTKKRRMGRGMRGLGGTPAEHHISMEGWATVAKSFFDKSAQVLESSRAPGIEKCRYALDYLTDAQADLGRAEAHSDEAPKFSHASLMQVRKLGGDVRRMFEAKCLVGGGMSGLGRKPTRRKSRR